MNSRYNAMKDSTSIDEVDKQNYPDVLSVDYTTFVFSTPPVVINPDTTLQQKPYYFTALPEVYGEPAYDDMLFNVNNVPHTSLLFDFPTLNVPSKADVLSFLGGRVQ